MMHRSATLLLSAWLGLFASLFAQITPPDSLLPEFSDQLVSDDWPFLVGYEFDAQGRMYAYTKDGKVWLSEDGQRPAQPLIDITEEVANFGDHGLISFNLHPNFEQNGYVYLLYTVDRHHLLYYGTSEYRDWKDEHYYPSIGRLVRYQLEASTNFTTVVPASRTVLIGETIDTGIPLLHNSHGLGSIVWGKDQSLLLSVGDGASYAGIDLGGDESGALAEQALAEGIIDSTRDIGAFRAQSIHSLNGKILRLDPMTGEGLSSNPFFDPGDPTAAQSRVYALGFRNPYRFVVMPNTGSHDITEGNPGILLVSDVGWGSWEEWNRVDEPGQNFGWPLYEGINLRWHYYYKRIDNVFAPNPSFGQDGCNQRFFAYNDLLQNPTAQGDPVFPNPCQHLLAVPDSIPTFVHVPPMLTYNNSAFNLEDVGTFTPDFEADGTLGRRPVDTVDSPIASEMFDGICTVGGTWYQGGNFPADYRGKLFMGDYRGWIKVLTFDTLTWDLVRVEPFMERVNGPARPISLGVNPADGCLWYIDYLGSRATLRRICFGGNPPPRAVIEADRRYGPSPLTVAFTGENSFDPDEDSLAYRWDFGDGQTSTQPNPSHTFRAEGAEPQAFQVRLTVTDPEGESHQRATTVSLNNTPPVVDITSVPDGGFYTMGGISNVPLEAQVTDAEHSDAELFYQWQLVLHHNDHQHPEPFDTARRTRVMLIPEGCSDETFWYRIRLEVRDPAGLRAVGEVLLYPYCGTPANEFGPVEVGFFDWQEAEVRWQMQKETPGTVYHVEQSADKLFFESIGQVVSDGRDHYEFRQPQPDLQLPFYRIKAVSPDSLVEYSAVMRSEFWGKPAIWLYPSPARQRLYLEMEQVEGEAWIEVLDLQGRLLSRASWLGDAQDARFPLTIRDLPAGLYLYRASDGREVQTGRFRKL